MRHQLPFEWILDEAIRTAVVLFNLLIDLLYSQLDPRVRYD